ncbi:MAG: RnfABCDGE type electron transport complex subunit D, partial [Phycisphaeraceae bacterium]
RGAPSSSLVLQSSPFLKRETTTPGLMREVMLAVLPVVGVAVWFFGLSAILLLAAATAGALGTEYLLTPARPRGASLRDGSAVLTGLLLGLTLPPTMPLWMAFVGGAAGVGLGKLAFGGLGHNLFNPALVGRAFLQAAFPTAITSWAAPGGPTTLFRSNFALPLMSAPQEAIDAVSTATPLGLMKFEQTATQTGHLLLGSIPGSLGETAAVVILLCGLFLVLRRTMDWRIPAAIVLSVAVFSVIPWAVAEGYPSPWMMISSGGLLFGAVYMATDPVTSPTAPLGAWVFGIGVGAIVVLIRLWGGLPEGVMYAILLMNAATPLIERACQPRGFGRGRAAA